MVRARYVVIAVLVLIVAGSVLVWKWSSFFGTGTDSSSGSSLVQLIPADFGPVVEKVAPALVRIETVSYGYWYWQPIVQTGLGTGVLVSSDGYIVTNKHVVEGVSQQNISIYLPGRSSPATPAEVWVATDTDLAVLKIEEEGLPFAVFADPGGVQAGQWVLAFGYPYALAGEATVSQGIISATGRTIELNDGTILEHVIQITAAINPGNSGGPLVDLSGNIVGINTAIIQEAENIGFAIGVDAVIPVVEQVKGEAI